MYCNLKEKSIFGRTREKAEGLIRTYDFTAVIANCQPVAPWGWQLV